MNALDVISVPPAPEVCWRATGIGRLLEPVPWAILEQAAGLAGRYDFPKLLYPSVQQDERYQMLYLSTRTGSLAEKLQDKKTPLQFYARLLATTNNSPGPAIDPRLLPTATATDLLKWLVQHEMIRVEVDTDLPLFAIEDSWNLAALRRVEEIAKIALSKGHDVNLHAITDDDYELTQMISYYVYNQRDFGNQPCFAGIAYSSHMGRTWPCAALFRDRIRVSILERQALTLDDPDLREILGVFGITAPVPAPASKASTH